jgi:hypothetical protein
MDYLQPQGASAPMPQQVNQPYQGYAPMPQPVNQSQQAYAAMPQQVNQPQGTDFYGVTIDSQTMAVVQQCYSTGNSGLNTTLNDSSTVAKSLYFGARDMFKTLYANQISSQRGSKPTTPDYELASTVFEQTFGTVGQPRVDQMQLCLTMKTFAPNILPDCVAGNRPHEAILNYILNQNWHSQNVRTNNGVSRNSNGNGNGNPLNGTNPFSTNGGAQSKANAAAGFVPQQSVGFMAQPQAVVYTPQQSAQAVAGAMPNYGG